MISTGKGECEYRGDIIDGHANGQGEGIWKRYGNWNCGATYVGAWKKDQREGHGTITWGHGHKYDGAWKNDQREGHGTFTYANGDKYDGA